MFFLLQRIAWMLLTLWIVFTVSFFLMRFVPGGPFDSEKKVPDAVKRNLEKRFRMDQPLWRQYLESLGNVARLDFGDSMRLEDFTVNQIIHAGFPVSASLGILALEFALLLGLVAGVLSATWRNSLADILLMSAATLGIAVPNFILASLAVVFFVFWLHLLPAAGWGRIDQLILPALCVGAPYAAYIARLTRAGMLETLNLDYVRTAYAKGLSPRTVILRHALRGALLPVVSYVGPATAGILTGSLVLERIFNIAGLGSHFIDAATQKDYTLVMGLVMVYTFLLCVMNLLADLSYAIIDPRVKVE